MRLFNKAGDSVIVDPGSEAEALWRAKGFMPADEVETDGDTDDKDDEGGETTTPDQTAAAAAARIASKKRGK